MPTDNFQYFTLQFSSHKPSYKLFPAMKSKILSACIVAICFTLSVQSQTNPINNNSLLSGQLMYNPEISPLLPLTGVFDNPSKSPAAFASLADSLHASSWDTVSAAFKLDKRTFYVYDSGGQILESTKKSIDKSGLNWQNFSQQTYLYTGSQLSKTVSKQWGNLVSDWKNTWRYDYYYDTLNVLTGYIINTWEGDSIWVYSVKYAFVYNASKQVITTLIQSWNHNLKAWDNSSRYTNAYAGGNLSSTLLEIWNSTSLTWDNYSRDTYTFVGANNTEILTERYDPTGSAWFNFRKHTFTYIGTGLKDTDTETIWDGTQWVNAYQNKFTYTNNDLTDYLVKSWQAHLNDWRNQSEEITYYSQHEVFGIGEIPVQSVLVTNPVKKGSSLRLMGLEERCIYRLSLTAMSGQKVMNLNAVSNEIITFNNNIPAGMYLLKAVCPGKKTLLQKLLITN